MPPTLYLPKAVAHRAPGKPWLHVRYSSKARLVGTGWTILIEVYADRRPDATLLKEIRRARRKNSEVIPLVTSGVLSQKSRATLEAADVGYLDAFGRMHLSWPGGLVH